MDGVEPTRGARGEEVPRGSNTESGAEACPEAAAESAGATVTKTGVLRAPRAAAVAGVVFSVLFTAAAIMIRSLIWQTEGGAAPDWATDSARRMIGVAGLYLLPFAGMAFLWLMAVVRDRIGGREDRFYGTVFFGSGILFIALLMSAAAVAGSIAAGSSFLGNEVPTAELIALIRSVSYTLMFVYAVKMAGAFMLVTATIARHTGVYPRWIAWSGIIIALILLFSISFLEEVLLLFPAWVMTLSVYSLVRGTSVGEALSLEEEHNAASL